MPSYLPKHRAVPLSWLLRIFHCGVLCTSFFLVQSCKLIYSCTTKCEPACKGSCMSVKRWMLGNAGAFQEEGLRFMLQMWHLHKKDDFSFNEFGDQSVLRMVHPSPTPPSTLAGIRSMNTCQQTTTEQVIPLEWYESLMSGGRKGWICLWMASSRW